MLLILLPLLGVLAGAGAALIFRAHSVAAAAGAAAIPIALLYAFAVYRLGPEIVPHPGLWIQAILWAAFVAAGYGITRFTRPR